MQQPRAVWVVVSLACSGSSACGARTALSISETSQAGRPGSAGVGGSLAGTTGSGGTTGKGDAGSTAAGGVPTLPPGSYWLSAGFVSISDIATHRDGRVAVAGGFRGGPLVINGVEQLGLASEGGGFVLVLERDGQQAWLKGFLGPSSSDRFVKGVAFAPDGDVLLQGDWRPDFTEPPVAGLNTVARLASQDGSVRWRQLFGNYGTHVRNVAATSDNDVVACGNFEYSLSLGDSVLEDPGTAGYVLRLDDNGTQVWLRKVERNGWALRETRRIALDARDQVYVLGAGTLPDLTPAAFLARWHADGSEEQSWMQKEYSGPERLDVNALAVRRDSLAIGGAFQGRWTVETNILQTIRVVEGDVSTDAWLLSYSRTGIKKFLESYSSPGDHAGVTVTSLAAGESSVVAVMTGQSLLIGEVLEPRPPKADAVWIVSYDVDGTRRWLHELSGNGLNAPASAVDAAQNVWVGVNFTSGLSLDGDTPQLTARNEGDALLLRLSSDGAQQ